MSAKWRIARIDLGNGANKINKEPIEFHGFWMSFLHESLFIGSFCYSIIQNFQISRQKIKLQGRLERKLKEIVKYQASPFKVSNLVIVEFLYFLYEIL
jgi:hypothetical protein